MTTAPEDNIRQIIATPRTTARVVTPASSLPTMPASMQSTLEPETPASTLEELGPLGGLEAGVIAGVQLPKGDGTEEEIVVPRTEVRRVQNADGSVTIFWSDGTEETLGKPGGVPQDNSKRQSAYDVLLEEFKRYGLESLVTPLKELITDPTISESEFSLKLRGSKAYTDRFKANEARIGKGLRALSEADYIRLEDQYQNIMRNYGMPASYYSKGELGRQQALEKFIAADVSATELEDRIMTAQERVIRGAPQIAQALKEFYPEITNGDILAYALDPANAMKEIQRKVTAAEIGGAALQQTGLTTSVSRAEELQRMGVDKAAATAGYSMIGGGLQRGSELASIYGESPYTQATAESEVFKLSGEQEARKQRQKVTGLEKATFGGQSGLTSGALARDRAGGI
jgi:hypothetical protein